MNAGCLQCLKAMQRVVHREYEEGCMGCAIRRLAYLSQEDRERYYDRVQHLGGMADRNECIRLVNLERARIKALAEAVPKERV